MYNRKLCCKVPVVGPQGPTGPTGPTGAGTQDNAILFFNNITVSAMGTALLQYDDIQTQASGIYKFMDGTANTSNITFSNVPAGNYWVEFYAHCDATAGSSGSSNYVTIDLVQQNGVSSLSPIDIDTRSVEKGTQAHLAFGNAGYRIGGPTGVLPAFVINRDATYRLRVQVGRDYTLEEIRLVIKVRPYSG
jgi:hypothetical protein